MTSKLSILIAMGLALAAGPACNDKETTASGAEILQQLESGELDAHFATADRRALKAKIQEVFQGGVQDCRELGQALGVGSEPGEDRYVLLAALEAMGSNERGVFGHVLGTVIQRVRAGEQADFSLGPRHFRRMGELRGVFGVVNVDVDSESRDVLRVVAQVVDRENSAVLAKARLDLANAAEIVHGRVLFAGDSGAARDLELRGRIFDDVSGCGAASGLDSDLQILAAQIAPNFTDLLPGALAAALR